MDRTSVKNLRRRGYELPAFAVIISVVVALVMIPAGFNQAASNLRLVTVDVGEDDGYTGAVGPSGQWSMEGWGPVEPDQSGGGYGDAATLDIDCRTTWSYHYDDSDSPSAKLTIPMPQGYSGTIQYIKMCVLDGLVDDSYRVWVYDPCDMEWVVVGEYIANGDPAETWEVSVFWLWDDEGNCLVPHGAAAYAVSGFQMVIEPIYLNPDWDIEKYGQLAVDTIELYGNGIFKQTR